MTTTLRVQRVNALRRMRGTTTRVTSDIAFGGPWDLAKLDMLMAGRSESVQQEILRLHRLKYSAGEIAAAIDAVPEETFPCNT